MDFVVPIVYRVKLKGNEKKYKYSGYRIEKTVELESDGDINCNWCSWYNDWKLVQWLEGWEIRGQLETL